MKYEIHNDRILLHEDSGKTVAQIQFPEVGKDVCEIAHIFGENSAKGREDANCLMEMAVAELRRSGRKLIPGCAFAVHWIKKHPEASDLVTDWDAVREMEEALYSEPADTGLDPAYSSGAADAQGGRSTEADLSDQLQKEAEALMADDAAAAGMDAGTEAAAAGAAMAGVAGSDPAAAQASAEQAPAQTVVQERTVAEADLYRDAERPKESGRKSRKEARRERRANKRMEFAEADPEYDEAFDELEREQTARESARQARRRRQKEEEAAMQAAETEEQLAARRAEVLEEKELEREKSARGEKRLNNSLSIVLRILQVISLICMIAVIALFVMAARQQELIKWDTFGNLVTLCMIGAFVLFCVIQLFWIMSRKRYNDPFSDSYNRRYDVGRGVFGFVIVLIVSFLCGMVINFVPQEYLFIPGISQFSSAYQVHLIPIVYAAIAGLVLCVIRKVAGRQMFKNLR